MGLDIKAPENVILKPTITVFGVGGAGGNAVNNMIRANLKGANFVVANTDAQALKNSESVNKIQLGLSSTKGLGAGASPDVGKNAALESESEIRSYLEGSNMVFITSGMGGGTGTGASPIVAKIARELGILTVGVVTKPFLFEGAKRMRVAEGGLAELQKHVDTLIVIPNQNLFRIANENTTFQEAFEMADEVLHAGVRGVTDLITSPGLVNLDFADIETVMSEKGKAMMGTGESSGEERAIKAAEAAIANPLLDQSSMFGARGVLINITGGKDMTLYEVDSAANRIREEVGDPDANIIFGSTFNSELEGKIRVSVVATGIEHDEMNYVKTTDTLVEVKSELNDNTQVANDKYSLASTVSIDDHQQPPTYNEYNSINDSEAEIQQKLEQIGQQIDWKIEQQPAKVVVTSSLHSNSSTKPQQSLLRRMWNSLNSNDATNDNALHNHVETSASSVSDKISSVHEAPDFLRKR